MAETISITEWGQGWQEFIFCILQLYEYGQKDLLMIPISREKHLGKLIQALDPGNLIMADLDFGAWHFFKPCLFDENMAFERGMVKFEMLKFFRSAGVG